MNCVTPAELKAWKDSDKDFFLLDVREQNEWDAFNVGGTHIPFSDIQKRLKEIPSDMPIVVVCERGIRSIIVMQRLTANGFTDLYNLTGGLKAWKSSFRESAH